VWQAKLLACQTTNKEQAERRDRPHEEEEVDKSSREPSERATTGRRWQARALENLELRSSNRGPDSSVGWVRGRLPVRAGHAPGRSFGSTNACMDIGSNYAAEEWLSALHWKV
jgi:hypothetical protein